MRVLLINPPAIDKWKISSSNIHMGIAYIASYLESKGIETDIIDCPVFNYSIKDVIDKFCMKSYDVVGISCYFYNYVNVIRIAREIKLLNPDVFLLMGGYQPSLNYQRMKKDFKYFNCFVIGEGEVTIFKIIQNLDNENWKSIPGIVYLKNEELFYTGNAELVQDIDSFPMPKRVFYGKEAFLITIRGCYGACNFCCSNGFRAVCKGRYVRRRSVENVIEEIIDLINHGAETINIYDSTFDISSKEGQKWIDNFIRIVKERNLNFKFTCYFRVTDIIQQHDRINELIKIGLVNIFVGIESFIQKHLDFYNKHVTVEQNIEALHILDNMNITYDIGFILLNPITTLEEIIETAEIFKLHNFNKNKHVIPRTVSSGTLIAFFGSPIYDFIVKNNLADNSVKGYRFVDKRVELCHQIFIQWNHFLEKLYDKYGLYLKLSSKGCRDLENKLKDIYYKANIIDIEFIEYVAKTVLQNQKGNLSDYSDMISIWTKKLEPLLEEMNIVVQQAEEVL